MFAHLAVGVEPWYEPCGFWRAFKDYDGQPVNIRQAALLAFLLIRALRARHGRGMLLLA
jgi:hypothetical protein